MNATEYRRLRDLVRTFGLSDADSDDVTQIVALELWRYTREDAAFSVCVAGQNRARDHVRNESRHAHESLYESGGEGDERERIADTERDLYVERRVRLAIDEYLSARPAAMQTARITLQ